MQVRAAFLTWVSSALYELTRTGAIWEPTFASSSPQGPSSSLARRWRAATTSSPSPSLTLTASLARESARLPGSKSTVLYPLSGDPDDLVGDGELSLVVALLWFSSGDPVDLAGDGEESLVAVVALFCWLSSKRDGSFSVVRNCESLDRWLTEGCSFSFEGSAALLKKMTLLLPCCAAAHLPWSDLHADELEARELVEEVLKRAGPRLERLPPPPSLFAWLLVEGLVEPLLRIPNELPIEDSLGPGRRIFEGVPGSTEPLLSSL